MGGTSREEDEQGQQCSRHRSAGRKHCAQGRAAILLQHGTMIGPFHALEGCKTGWQHTSTAVTRSSRLTGDTAKRRPREQLRRRALNRANFLDTLNLGAERR